MQRKQPPSELRTASDTRYIPSSQPWKRILRLAGFYQKKKKNDQNFLGLTYRTKADTTRMACSMYVWFFMSWTDFCFIFHNHLHDIIWIKIFVFLCHLYGNISHLAKTSWRIFPRKIISSSKKPVKFNKCLRFR